MGSLKVYRKMFGSKMEEVKIGGGGDEGIAQ
jgi:hypothetical protein